MSLVARSWLSMKRMLSMLRKALGERGLALHPSKCKVQTNLQDSQICGDIYVEDGFFVEVLAPGDNLVLLGTLLNLDDVSSNEITNRIAAGWKLFWSLKRLLLNRKSSIARRLRLFDTTVGSCVTWCCESWAPRAEELRKLETARRSMLRKIVCVGRGPHEEWIDWIQRATHKALNWSARAGVREWVSLHFERKWHWAGHVARRGQDTWLHRVTTWRDAAWQSVVSEMGSSRELRPSRRRWMKWEAPLRRFCAANGLGQWTELAENREQWAEYAGQFCAWIT